MSEQVLLYISAATDLEPERDMIARAVTEIPVDLGWRIAQSPRKNEPMDIESISNSDVHLLLVGGDIRAPIGLEWATARRAGRQPIPFLKQSTQRTPAAQNYVRHIEQQASWQRFKDSTELRREVLELLADFLLGRALHFPLTPTELEQLRDWRSDLKHLEESTEQIRQGGAGDSSVIFSIDRFTPSQGVLLQPDDGEE